MIYNEFTFLKSKQVEGFLSKANYVVCAAIAQPLVIDKDLSTAIAAALPMDSDVRPYLEQLWAPELPQDEETQDYLQPFTLLSDIVLYNELVYVPKSNELKLWSLWMHHDATSAEHLR